MDRMIHTALTTLANARDEKVSQAQNLANMNVPGFRRDLQNNGGTAFLDTLNGLQTRAYQLEAGPIGFSEDAGPLQMTGEKMDIAIADEGYFYIMPENGETALSRRGDLVRTPDGFLLDGAGNQMLDSNLAPINVPPFLDLVVTDIGNISITTADGGPGNYVTVATLGTVVPAKDQTLFKGLDGNIRLVDGTVPQPTQTAAVIQGSLEGSNVDAVSELIASMELQRDFEIGLKLISNAKEIDEGGERLMTAPE